MARLVLPPAGAAHAPASAPGAPPTLDGISIVFGVGARPDATPDASDFHPVYEVTLPVFALSALDPDGVHEFDAAALLDPLALRATRRRWGVRVELSILQPAAVSDAAVLVEVPDSAGPPAPAGDAAAGRVLPGGGRRLRVGTRVVPAGGSVADLEGIYQVGYAPKGPSRAVELALSRFEFEPPR